MSCVPLVGDMAAQSAAQADPQQHDQIVTPDHVPRVRIDRKLVKALGQTSLAITGTAARHHANQITFIDRPVILPHESGYLVERIRIHLQFAAQRRPADASERERPMQQRTTDAPAFTALELPNRPLLPILRQNRFQSAGTTQDAFEIVRVSPYEVHGAPSHAHQLVVVAVDDPDNAA